MSCGGLEKYELKKSIAFDQFKEIEENFFKIIQSSRNWLQMKRNQKFSKFHFFVNQKCPFKVSKIAFLKLKKIIQ